MHVRLCFKPIFAILGLPYCCNLLNSDPFNLAAYHGYNDQWKKLLHRSTGKMGRCHSLCYVDNPMYTHFSGVVNFGGWVSKFHESVHQFYQDQHNGSTTHLQVFV